MCADASKRPPNQDERVIAGFGDEWSRFDQQALSATDRTRIFNDYFAIFPWTELPAGGGEGADIGCGSGRWALQVSPRIGVLHCVDPSGEALAVARRNLAGQSNVLFHQAGVDALPFVDASLDFAYSLGVLHHVPDTAAAIHNVAAKLKPGAPFLIYLYYGLDNRPFLYRLLWRLSDFLRQGVARLPLPLRYTTSQVLAATFYWPVARFARVLERLGCLPASWPLAYYRDKDFYVMRTDALDRFGTRLEQRFTRAQIHSMLEGAGFEGVKFSDRQPFWCALARRR